MLLIKFGKKEHLEQLKNGIVHFSQLETFQNDPTTFRGDRMEGRDFLDPSQPFLINGHDISPYIKEAIISHEYEDTLLSFSASLLSHNNCHPITDDGFSLNDSFIEEMKKFGDSFLIFNAYNFIDSLKQEFDRTLCSFEYHPIQYIDKHDYSSIRKYYSSFPEEEKSTKNLFVKDTTNGYPLQNEWRIVVFDHANHYLLNHGGANIQTSFTTEMPIFPVDVLHTLRCSREFLFE